MTPAPAGGNQLDSVRAWERAARHRDALVAFARMAGATVPEAEDAAHDALVRGVTSGRLTETGQPLAYLRRITINVLVDRHRSRTRERAAYRQLADPCPGPGSEADEVVARNLASQVIRRLQAVEPARVVAMVLCRVAGSSWREVAAAAGVSTSAAQAAVRRALLRVSAWLHR